jgi:hypothetical protein
MARGVSDRVAAAAEQLAADWAAAAEGGSGGTGAGPVLAE